MASLSAEAGFHGQSNYAAAKAGVQGLTRVYYAPASDVVIFVVMVIVLLARPAGLFGKAA